MLKYIKLFRRIARKSVQCVRPYNGFRNRKVIKSFYGVQQKFYVKFWNNAAKAIGASLTEVGYGYFKISRENSKTYVKNYNVMLDDHVTLNIAGNKPLVLKILESNEFEIPKFLEYKIDDVNKAQDFLNQLGRAAVVKPASGTGSGRGVTMHIDSKEKLHKASVFAASFCDTLLIEEQVEGDSFRLLYLNGKFVDAIRRDPPVVIGDGKNSIKDLIKIENDRRIQSPEIITFHPLIVDMECKLKLKEQGLSVNSVLALNQKVIVKKVVNQNSCLENHIVREQVHPSIITTGHKVVTELGITLGGIDVITSDISKPLSEVHGIINEINTTPGLHHHLLVAEKDQILPIGEMVLDYILTK